MTRSLIQMIYNFKNQYGRDPKGIYLGHNEIDRLVEDAGSKQLLADCIGRRWEIYGVPVFRVDADDHLNIG